MKKLTTLLLFTRQSACNKGKPAFLASFDAFFAGGPPRRGFPTDLPVGGSRGLWFHSYALHQPIAAPGRSANRDIEERLSGTGGQN